MEKINDALKYGAGGEIAHASAGAYSTIAKILNSDEVNNLCTIEYCGDDCSMHQMKSVAVDLRNTKWFPKPGEIVLAKINGRTGIVEQKYTEDYNADIGGGQQLTNDIHSDSDGTCGGCIGP